MPRKKTNQSYHGIGRRKKSVARVYMVPGTGKIMIGEKTLEQYFPQELLQMVVKSPLVETQTEGSYDIFINVFGGGSTGQAGAMRHGISRALLEVGEDYRPILKKAGFLTRDPRSKERKKYGLKGARRAPQYSKR